MRIVRVGGLLNEQVLKRELARRDINQNDLARRIGTTRQEVSAILNGEPVSAVRYFEVVRVLERTRPVR